MKASHPFGWSLGVSRRARLAAPSNGRSRRIRMRPWSSLLSLCRLTIRLLPRQFSSPQ